LPLKALTHCSNNYRPFQHPEKLIVRTIARAIRGETLPADDNGGDIRDWLHVEDHARAFEIMLRRSISRW
jgi:dTDP-glucose 4,6-dehydratase